MKRLLKDKYEKVIEIQQLDHLGNIVEITDRNGYSSEFINEYDENNNLLSIRTKTEENQIISFFEYDQNGNCISEFYDDHFVRSLYNSKNRLIAKTKYFLNDKCVHYIYDYIDDKNYNIYTFDKYFNNIQRCDCKEQFLEDDKIINRIYIDADTSEKLKIKTYDINYRLLVYYDIKNDEIFNYEYED